MVSSMKDRAIGLVDCNNFFVSCERRRYPELQDRPVVVLSSNDGCVVARSNEVKRMGVPMAAPYFKVKRLLEYHDTVVLSSDLPYYRSVSAEVMRSVAEFTDMTEVYSIDESFLNMAIRSVTDPVDYAHRIRRFINDNCSIPVSIGIAPTKTLAKIASEFAKKNERTGGVFHFDRRYYTNRRFMSSIPCSDIWGIGRKTSEGLSNYRVKSAYDLSQCDDMWLKKKFSVTTMFTKWEICGESAFQLVSEHKPQKSIMVSRSFGVELTSFEDLLDPLMCFTVSAANQLRRSGQCATKISIHIATNRFKKFNQYSNSCEYVFDSPKFADCDFMEKAEEMLRRIYREGYSYKKCGIVLSGFAHSSAAKQVSLFSEQDEEKVKSAVSAIDKINSISDCSLIKPATLFTAPNDEKKWVSKSDFHKDEERPKKSNDNTFEPRFRSHAEDFI